MGPLSEGIYESFLQAHPKEIMLELRSCNRHSSFLRAPALTGLLYMIHACNKEDEGKKEVA